MTVIPPGGTPRKDSIFSGITPAPAPASAPAPAARPSVDADAVAALKQKIDALEKNIVSQLEKKMGEHLKQAAPAAQPPAAAPAPQPQAPAHESVDLLRQKMEEMERRLADFNHSASLSASQLKNIEESKIGARREIEDLLKAVREQQKYSEMDRQIHDQLEKAWTRAEELEKKLMEFYSSVLAMEAKRRDDNLDSSYKSARAVDALAARLAGLEEKIAALASGMEGKVGGLSSVLEGQAAAIASGLEEKMAALTALLDQKITALSSGPATAEMKSARDELFSLAEQERRALREAQEDFLSRAEHDRRALLAAQESAARELREAMSENFAAVEEFRRALREQAAAADEKFSHLEKLSRAGSSEVSAAQQELRELFAAQSRSAEDFWGHLEASLGAAGALQAASLKAEVERQLAGFGALHAEALVSADLLHDLRAALSGAIEKMEAFEAPLSAFLANTPADRLAQAMGVSGEILRSDYHALAEASRSLKERLAALRELKLAVEKRARGASGGR